VLQRTSKLRALKGSGFTACEETQFLALVLKGRGFSRAVILLKNQGL